MRAVALIVTLLLTSFLWGCSTTKSQQSSVIQIPSEAWWIAAENKSMRSSQDYEQLDLNPSSAQNVAIARKKIAAVSPISFVVGFSNNSDINAFATLQDDRYYVIFTKGFMRQFGNDPDVIANVLGHELGHHQSGHTQPDYGKNREVAINVASQALGMISSYFIPYSGLLVGNVVKGAGLSYSRDDERDSDAFGMQIAMKAGYSPCGSYRFASKMSELGQGPALTFLSTHPANEERIQTSQAFSLAQNKVSCINLKSN